MAKSVNELPGEILSMMFFEFVEQEMEPWQMREWSLPQRLAGVCRLWKEVVEAGPELWSRIDVNFGDERSPMAVEPIKNKIQKAKRSPLALCIHGWRARTHSTVPVTRDVLALYELVKDHRWRALSIFDPEYLSSYEIIFRHIIDNPQLCRITSFRMTGVDTIWYNNGVTHTLIKQALQQNLGITYLLAEAPLLESSHPLLQVVPNLQLRQASTPTRILRCVREASCLRSLRVDQIWTWPEGDDPALTCTLSKLEHLDLRECRQFPKRLLLRLDLPKIRSLTFKVVKCTLKDGDEQLKNFFSTVPWFKQLKSLALEEVQVSEEALLFALRRLPLLVDLTLASQAKVSCKMTKTLSLSPKGRRGWLNPLLEDITFGECPRLSESDVIALVEARLCDLPSTAPTSAITEDHPPPSRLRKVICKGRDMVERG
ncbi:hypothetical protein FRB94_006416 [Tulasnella sp. JGI-2019a]|nr:hypothetical protein FRB93_006189 [Tulasnella sp. JGI-2019a]KAG8999175.1 hypothetical protein FRB94_006416 [Tulasnella sp. JGI-2019a]